MAIIVSHAIAVVNQFNHCLAVKNEFSMRGGSLFSTAAIATALELV